MIADLLSCCVVLLHTGWCMRKLREVARADDNGRKAAAVNLKKLILLMVFCTCVCHLLRVFHADRGLCVGDGYTSYRYHWTSVVAGELATLVFYVYMGYKLKLAGGR